jgi:hypothetical protein
VLAQQWGGGITSTSAIYRSGAIGIGSSSSPDDLKKHLPEGPAGKVLETEGMDLQEPTLN